MISPINTNISTGSIAYQEELNNLAKQAENVTVQKKDPLKAPTQDVARTAQVSSDIAVSNDAVGPLKKPVSQLVVENSSRDYDREERIKSDFQLKRDIGSVDAQSAIGTTVNEGMPSSEINAKTKAE